MTKWYKISEKRAPAQEVVLCFFDSRMETARCFHNEDQHDDWVNSMGFPIFPDFWSHLPNPPGEHGNM